MKLEKEEIDKRDERAMEVVGLDYDTFAGRSLSICRAEKKESGDCGSHRDGAEDSHTRRARSRA